MKWSPLIKLLLGLFLAVAFLTGMGVFAMRYVAQVTAPPPKPMFPNDRPSVKVTAKPSATKPSAKPAAKPSPQPSASPSPTALKPGTYYARITQPDGLNVRESPDKEANRVGGVIFNEQVIVLEESADGGWQRIRLESNGTEGWIKAGNSERVEANTPN
jgi:hypothetical protein